LLSQRTAFTTNSFSILPCNTGCVIHNVFP
jgi:hypothetical protein